MRGWVGIQVPAKRNAGIIMQQCTILTEFLSQYVEKYMMHSLEITQAKPVPANGIHNTKNIGLSFVML